MGTPVYKPVADNEKALIELMLSDFAKKFQTCIPAIVEEVISRDTVKVSPAIQQTDLEGNPIRWASVRTNVLTPFSNGLFLSMPLKVGDTGWLVAADLDTSGFKKTKQASQQTGYSGHLYQYGFFVPDAINGYSVSEDDMEGIVLSNLSGTTKIVLKEDEIDIESENLLKINAKSINIISNNNNVVVDGINFKNHVHSGGTLANSAGTVQGITGMAESGGE